MATIDQELQALYRYLRNAAIDLTYMGPQDEHFYEEFDHKVDAVIYELAASRARIHRLLPSVPDEVPGYVQAKR